MKDVHLCISLTDRCQQACWFCAHDETLLGSRQDLAIDRLCAALLDFSGYRIHCIVTGGEPTIHPMFREASRELRNNATKLGIATHGQCANAWPIIASSYDVVAIPLYGDRHTHDNVVGRHGSWDRSCEALQYLSNASPCHVVLKILALPELLVAYELVLPALLARLKVQEVHVSGLRTSAGVERTIRTEKWVATEFRRSLGRIAHILGESRIACSVEGLPFCHFSAEALTVLLPRLMWRVRGEARFALSASGRLVANNIGGCCHVPECAGCLMHNICDGPYSKNAVQSLERMPIRPFLSSSGADLVRGQPR